MSEKCQFRTHAAQQIRPIRHLVAAAEHRMRYHRIDRDRGFESRRQACRRLVNADSWVAKPSQAVQYRRD
jgi:bisphosphoglycerate-independent phosphoglycerate mutase (AlkP superfamily)